MQPPKRLVGWLNCESFLTQKLKELTGDATLKVLHQSMSPTNAWEREILLVNDPGVLRRDILMYSNDTPCWYARTVVADSTYAANTELFARLNHETLGHLIFFDTQITRSSIEKYSISASSIEYSWLPAALSQSARILWMRKSTFHIHKTWPLFLMEIYLPGLVQLIAA